jgi:hypothetical protein
MIVMFFSLSCRDRLLDAVKKPTLVRLLSTLVKVGTGTCGVMGAGKAGCGYFAEGLIRALEALGSRLSSVGGMGWPGSVFMDLS